MAETQELVFSTVLAASVHDMKNSIGMLTHLIDEVRPRLPEENPQFAMLQFEAAKLNNDLIRLMTLYKLEQDQYRSAAMEYYLDEFIEDLLLLNRPILEPRGITLDTKVEADLSWTFDGQLVTGVLGTVLTNLINFADGRLSARASRARLVAEQVGEYLCLRVEDNGNGFPQSMLGDLQSQAMGVDFINGSTGFGLYFSQQVAAQHHQGDRRGFVRLSNGSKPSGDALHDDRLGGGCFELFIP